MREADSPVRRIELAAVSLVAIGLLGMLTVRAWQVGVTVDEPSHLLSAHLYWQGADRLKPNDMPPLIKFAGGWVAGGFGLPIPRDNRELWESQAEWNIANEMMARMKGPEIRRVFFYSRLPLLVFPLGCVLLIWWWGRQLFSPPVGVLLAVAFALEPTAFGHGALFKNDLAATFGYLLFWYRAWRFWICPGSGNAARLGGALLLALLAKLSMLILVLAAPLLLIARYAGSRPPRPAAPATALALVLLIPYLGSLAAYQFDTRRLSQAELAAHAADPRIPGPAILAAHVFRVVPVAAPMWEGCLSLFHSNADESSIYLLGRRFPGGHPLYFLLALAVKVPVPLQLLLAGGMLTLGAALRRRKLSSSALLWLIPPFLYIGLASLSSLQLGVRLILPALPFGLFFCGAAMYWLLLRRYTIVVAGLLVWLGVRTAQVYPHPISFFNVWTGGPEKGLRYLADSNLDWGQNLRDLADLVHSRGIRKIHLSYFGRDNPYGYFREDEMELIPPPWTDELAQGPQLEPQPGYYAISANLLPGHFFEERYRNYYEKFRTMTPIATAGYSIYIYQVK